MVDAMITSDFRVKMKKYYPDLYNSAMGKYKDLHVFGNWVSDNHGDGSHKWDDIWQTIKDNEELHEWWFL